MRELLRQTRVRLALAYASVFSVVALAAALALWLALAEAEHSAIDEGLVAASRTMQAAVDAGGRGGSAASKLPGPSSSANVGGLLYEPGGSLVDRSGQTPPPAALAEIVRRATTSGSPLLVTQTFDGVSQRIEATLITLRDGTSRVLVVTRPTTEADQFLGNAALVLVAGMAVLIIAATVMGYGFAGAALRPVREIAFAARSLSENDLQRRITMSLPADELGDLARTFNDLLERLELAFQSLRRFTDDAAHEFRAPLTLIRTEAEVALRRPRSVEEYQASLATVLAETERLGRLADQLLLLARADAGALAPQMATVDLGSLAGETTAAWGPVAAEKGVVLTLNAPGKCLVHGDGDLLRRLLDNLIDNALRHSTAGSPVNVSCKQVNDASEIAVADAGPGVPDALRPNLFDRFTRADPARGRDSGGAGLGLALCAAIADLHHGAIALDTSVPRGARFVVTIPAVDRGPTTGLARPAQAGAAIIPAGMGAPTDA